MRNSYNKGLISSYMAWEKENAIKQIDEIMLLKKQANQVK